MKKSHNKPANRVSSANHASNVKSEKVAVLVSGGVDSALALTLLKKAGYAVEAFYLKIWLQDEFVSLGDCPWEEDLAVIKPITDDLGVRLHVIPFQEQYWKLIVDYTIERIKMGETPNPDIYCNSLIKFGAFLEYLKVHFPDFTKIASGHYAQVVQNHESPLHAKRVQLKTSPDEIKDQTYFLAQLTQEQLQCVLFPIGHLRKSEVRAYARTYELRNQARKDSQGLCFLGKIRFRDFIRFHLGEQLGEIVELETERVLGLHKGYWYHTIGQRQGLELSDGPWYVVDKDIKRNRVYVSRLEHALRKQFTVGALHWLSGVPLVGDEAPGMLKSLESLESSLESPELLSYGHYEVKIRHGGTRHGCTLSPVSPVPKSNAPNTPNTLKNNLKTERHAKEVGCYTVTLAEAEMGIAPGQFAVFYKDDLCVASSVIQSVGLLHHENATSQAM